MSKRKLYNPTKHPNPVIQSKKLEKLRNDIDDFKHLMSAVTQSYEAHMEHLANIARHDIGNAIQNLFATMTMWKGTMDEELEKELSSSITNIRSTLDNFGQLVPSDVNDSFTIHKLMIALQVLTRSSMQIERINLILDYDKNDKTDIHQPFQQILQLLHNLSINAVKSFTKASDGKIICVSANILGDSCVISVKDNGCGIPDENIQRVFEYGFTTTNGNGIGLAHAKFLCKEIGGTIHLERDLDNYSTIFTITIPLNYDSKKNNSN